MQKRDILWNIEILVWMLNTSNKNFQTTNGLKWAYIAGVVYFCKLLVS